MNDKNAGVKSEGVACCLCRMYYIHVFNREGPRSNPLCYLFLRFALAFSPRRPSSLYCIIEYMVVGSGGNVSE